MTTLEDAQAPIDMAIVDALIACAPRAWRAVRMQVERTTEPDGSEGHKISIDNPDGGRGLASLSTALTLEVRKLSLLFHERKAPFRKLVYEARAADDGAWDFTAKYEY